MLPGSASASPCQRLARAAASQARLQLFVLSRNLGNMLRRLCLPKAINDWPLRGLQVRLIRMGGQIVCHAGGSSSGWLR